MRLHALIAKSTCEMLFRFFLILRDELVHIKTGEEKKQKIYRALCILKEPATVEIMKKLDIPDGFLIQQMTPLRVLHRRPFLTRPRQIYSLKAYVHEGEFRMFQFNRPI